MATVPAETSTRRRVVLRVVVLLVTGVSLYLVAPALIEVLGSYREIENIGAGWLALMLASPLLSFGGWWECMRASMHERRRKPVILAQLAGNATGRIVPGGGATAAA